MIDILILCGKIDASLCVTTSFAGHGGYILGNPRWSQFWVRALIRRLWDQCRADGKPIMEESAKKAPSDHEDGSTAWASLGIGRDELMAGSHRLMGSVCC